MTTQEIANRLVELCRAGKNEQAYKELFAKNAVAVEPEHSSAPNTKGLDNLLEKSKQFSQMIKELHSSSVSDPLVGGNYFTCTMSIDATMQDGNRNNMEEVCVYEVKDGKITKEQFFF